MTSSTSALGLGLGSSLKFNSSKTLKNSCECDHVVASVTVFKGDSWQRQRGSFLVRNQRILLPLSNFNNSSKRKWSQGNNFSGKKGARDSLVFRCSSQERVGGGGGGRGEEVESLATELPRPVFISATEDGGVKNGSIEKINEVNGKITESVVLEKVKGERGGEGEGEGVLPKSGQWQKRWTIVGLCFFAFLLCNMDRVNMSIAILPMQEAYQWQPATVGLVQSSFFWGYLLTQVAGGIWADSIGGKQVLGFGVIWWSLATLMTPIAANLGLPALLFARACMGVGEGVAMPAMNNLLSRWVPVSERSRSLAFVYSGMYLGSVIGLSFSPFLIQSFGWPSVFYSFGSLGTVWLFLWQKKAFNSPDEDTSLSTEERQTLLLARAEGGLSDEKRVQNIPWRLLLSKTPVWAIIICHFCHNWGTFILLTWMPSYYRDVLHFNLAQSGFFSVLPWLTMAISANVGGWIADTLISRGTDITLVRKIMQTIGFLGPAFCLWQLPNITSPPMAVLCMMASQGMDAFSQSGLYSNHQDIGPRYSGVLLGISNTAGVLAGVLGTYLTGQILQHGSWDEVFKVAVGLYLVGAVVWNVAATGKRIFD